jgi:uncharacterized protein (DUF2384 family)
MSMTTPATARTRTRAPRSQRPQPAWQPQHHAEFLVENYGGVTAVAAALGVSKSQPSRWASGVEIPSSDAARRLLDLAQVFTRALMVWTPDVARAWLESPSSYLDGNARPIDMVVQGRSTEVVDALEAIREGAYA